MANVAGTGNGGGSVYGRSRPTSPKTQLKDPGLSMTPAVTPAPNQRSDQAKAQRTAIQQKGKGGIGGFVSEWTGPSLEHLLATGHVSSPGGTALDIASFLPVFRGPRALLKGLKAVKAAEEAGAVAEAATRARRVDIPKVPKGTVTPETGGDAGLRVREGLRGAGAARNAQNKLYSAERSVRAAKAEHAMQDIGGIEGHHAALESLKGELPKVDFAGFKNLDSESILSMIEHAQKHPDLLPLDKVTTVRAITKAVSGKVPTVSEQKLLERAFGKDVSESVVKAATWRDHLGRGLAEAVNLPRALEASFDLSAPFRQGLVAGVSHPVLFSRNIWPMMKAFKSEDVYNGIMDGIHSRETFPLMDKSGLAVTDVHSYALSDREERFMSRLIGKVPGLRGSERAYTGFLNKTRADIFDHLIKQAAEQGHNLNDENVTKSIAQFVNAATGRGSLGKLEPAAVVLNSTLFSPRLLASRLNFLNPLWYANLDPFARKEALKAAASLVLTIGFVLEVAKMAGAKVNTDPRNADFAKMRFGNTRVDVAAGFQQPIRLLFQEASGKIVSSTTGKTLTLGPGGPGHLSRWDIGERFAISKLAPVPSIASDVLHGQNFIGQPITAKAEASSHLIPLLWQDVYSLYKNGGVGAVAAGVIPGLFGVGLQTYGSKPPTPSRAKPRNYGSGGYSGKSPYGRGSSTSGSVYGARP